MERIQSSYTCRRFLSDVAIGTAGLALASRAFAQSESVVTSMRRSASDAKIAVHKIRDNVHMLSGSGGNITVLTGPESTALIDTGLSGSRTKITEALKNLNAKPVKHVINTHWHFDHTDGNEWLRQSGAEIIAHAKTRDRMAESTRVEAWKFTFPPAPENARPSEVFQKKHQLDFGQHSLELEYYEPCHTDTDVLVRLKAADVVAVGDTWWNGHYPFIDYSTGGSINEMIRATEKNIKEAGSSAIVVPGHGPAGGASELKQFLEMLVTLRDRIATKKKAGSTLDEVIREKPTTEFDAKWGGFVIDGKTFTALVYAGV
jgi:glyoxylase-like metal-dependent hydrolase (beta-lactamase superfamily II)